MARRAQALDGKKQGVSLDKLFPPSFMAEHTRFETVQAMFHKNEFVARHTKFTNW